MVTANHLLASFVKIITIWGGYLCHLLLLRHLSVPKVAQSPLNSVNFSRYDLSRLLLINLSLHSFLHCWECPREKFLWHLHIVLIFCYQTELCWVELLGLVEVNDNFLSEAGENADAFTAVHHADNCAVVKHYLDWFVTIGCEFSKICYLHLLVDLILACCHQCCFLKVFFCIWLSLALIIQWDHKVWLIEYDIWIYEYFLQTYPGQRRLSRVSHREGYCLTCEWTKETLFLKIKLIVRQELPWVLYMHNWIILVDKNF